MYIAGLDLGQAADFTALAIVQIVRRVEEVTDPLFCDDPNSYSVWRRMPHDPPPPVPRRLPDEYHVRHLQRWPRRTPYTDIAKGVARMLRQPILHGATLVVDQTGVGRPVVDILRSEGLRPVAVTITGGLNVARGEDGWHVPKRDLVASVVAALHSGRLKFARMPLVDELLHEAQNFRVKVSADGHDSYGAWREGEHDDLVLALALSMWWATRVRIWTVSPTVRW